MTEQPTVYELKYICVSIGSRYPVRKATVHPCGLYSSLEKAEEEITEVIRWREENRMTIVDTCVGFIISERLLDIVHPYTCCDLLSERTYTHEGAFNDACLWHSPANPNEYLPFCGRPLEQCRFRQGDIVECFTDNGDKGRMRLAIVWGTPITREAYNEKLSQWRERQQTSMRKEEYKHLMWDRSDDCYLLVGIGEGDTHFHVAASKVFAPTKSVPNSLRQKLKEKLKEMIETCK